METLGIIIAVLVCIGFFVPSGGRKDDPHPSQVDPAYQRDLQRW